ncbi:MAG TPA: hypothetical protein VH601_05040 [Bryobacteraceae bacterium]|jgi:hypothetical protein
MHKHVALFAAALCGFLPIAKASNLVTNSGFETGDFASWTLSGANVPDNSGIYYGVDGLNPHSGTFEAYFGSVGGILELSQTLSTVPGVSYTVTFWLAHSPETPFPYLNSFDASFGGSTLLSQAGVPDTGYTQYSFSRLATGTSTDLLFAFRDDTSYFSLDDVSVTPDAVPEPGSALLVLFPLTALFLGYRVRRTPR